MTIEETERQQYRGVVCLHCKAPIPVPSVVGLTRVAPAEDAETPLANSQVFNVRCSALLYVAAIGALVRRCGRVCALTYQTKPLSLRSSKSRRPSPCDMVSIVI